MDIHSSRYVVVVFAMKGCGACEEFLPRFRRIAAKYRRCVPVMHFDAAAPGHQAVADHYGVTHTPTVVLVRRPQGKLQWNGGLDDHEIENIFAIAARGQACGL